MLLRKIQILPCSAHEEPRLREVQRLPRVIQQAGDDSRFEHRWSNNRSSLNYGFCIV